MTLKISARKSSQPETGLRQEALPLETPVQKLNRINWPILFYFLVEKNEVRKREMAAACLIRTFQTVHML